jgi:lysyl-tRNA synthetase class 1
MGIPIYIAPSPDGKGTFGEYFGNKLLKIFKTLGINAEIYLASVYYKKGVYNDAIKVVLDNAQKVRKVYEDMYKKQIAKDWYPLQVICPKCGKLGTTKVTGWDGKEVDYICLPDLVKWAQGCGTKGKMSPFNGNAKMPFKVEWAAKWWTFGITIEGAGKDHASAGGTYDVARKICKDVFGVQPPLKIPYEHFLSGGKKMSSSKGLGLTGEELLEVLTPVAARFLMIKTEPNRAVEFEPKNTDIIPKVYDDYQKSAKAYFEKTGEDTARAFELSQIEEPQKPPEVRFSALSQLIQMPNMLDRIKKENLEEWAKYATVWIKKYAPDAEKFEVLKELPEEAKGLSDMQREYLRKIIPLLDKNLNGEDLQKELYELAKASAIPTKDAFAAIYLALIGKNHGPKAGWLILSLDKNFLKKRFSGQETIQSASVTEKNGEIKQLNDPKIFNIAKELRQKYPSISVGIAIIKGVSIKKENPELEKEKSKLLESLKGLTTEKLGHEKEIISYRKLYKDMGVDWHSRRPSPEALLRRVALNKGLYTINTCVDAYNLIVMKNRISIGAFDLDKITFPTQLDFGKAGEEILLLGDTEPTKYKPNEIAYFDQTGGYNLDFNYRDAQRTAATLETKNLYLNVDGIYDITPKEVELSLKEACDNIIKYCGGKIEQFGIEIGEK